MSRLLSVLAAEDLVPWVRGCKMCDRLHNESIPAPPREQRSPAILRRAVDEHFVVDHNVMLLGYGHSDEAIFPAFDRTYFHVINAPPEVHVCRGRGGCYAVVVDIMSHEIWHQEFGAAAEQKGD